MFPIPISARVVKLYEDLVYYSPQVWAQTQALSMPYSFISKVQDRRLNILYEARKWLTANVQTPGEHLLL